MVSDTSHTLVFRLRKHQVGAGLIGVGAQSPSCTNLPATQKGKLIPTEPFGFRAMASVEANELRALSRRLESLEEQPRRCLELYLRRLVEMSPESLRLGVCVGKQKDTNHCWEIEQLKNPFQICWCFPPMGSPLTLTLCAEV